MIKPHKYVYKRAELRKYLEGAVKAQVEVFNQLSRIEEIIGYVTGLDDFVRREASDWMNPDDVKLNRESLKAMFLEVKPEK